MEQRHKNGLFRCAAILMTLCVIALAAPACAQDAAAPKPHVSLAVAGAENDTSPPLTAVPAEAVCLTDGKEQEIPLTTPDFSNIDDVCAPGVLQFLIYHHDGSPPTLPLAPNAREQLEGGGDTKR